LTRLLSEPADADAAKTAARLKCGLCHATDPPESKHNVFGQEVARALEGQKDLSDRRAIQMALHRAVFLLRNRKPAAESPAARVGASGKATIRKRYVGTVLKENTQLAAYEMPLADVLSVLAENHEIDITLDGPAIKKAGLTKDVAISLVIAEVPLSSLLKYILGQHKLTYEVQGNALVVRPITQEQPAGTVHGRNEENKANSPVELAKTLKSYKGAKLQVTDTKGAKFSDILLDLEVSKDGKLESFSLFSAQSSSRKRHFELADVKEIRQQNRVLYSMPEETDPVVLESKRLEREVLLRERIARRERLEAAHRRQAGLEQAAGLLRDENGQFPLNRRYEEELGDGASVVGALGNRAASQATETRPMPISPPPTEPRTPTASSPAPGPTSPGDASPAESPPQPLGRKSVVISYRSSAGQPPSVRYGVRIRYETKDVLDPKVQQGALDEMGDCQLEVPEDVETIRVYTTPFGGFEGTHPLKSTGSTTISITTDGN
jgi:hypothetical protein